MLGLSSHDQAWFIGIRNTFYRFAILTGQGLLVILAGQLENIYDNVAFAWAIVFGGLSILFIIFAVYHKWVLPQPSKDIGNPNLTIKKIIPNISNVFIS